ncbi:MAG: response regulator, partial [Burkholderiaceae bacterium]
MRILVVEDEKKLADYLRKGLAENGCVVDVAHDGVDGLHLALTGEYELILLDVMLPRLDGFAVLKAIRESKDTAVLMLTARDELEDKVRGLRGGADDY